MTCGIYKIENTVSLKVYVGQSSDIDRRWRTWQRDLSGSTIPKGVNKHLYLSWKKHGQNNFVFSVLEECDESHLSEREQHWANVLRNQGVTLYNQGAYTDNPFRGQKHTTETLAKLSAAIAGKMAGKKKWFLWQETYS